jgi:hypothetical protein
LSFVGSNFVVYSFIIDETDEEDENNNDINLVTGPSSNITSSLNNGLEISNSVYKRAKEIDEILNGRIYKNLQNNQNNDLLVDTANK